MALQTSGAISISDIVTEFGGTAPHSLSEYYGADSGVPSSGTISISDFYGASAYVAPTHTYKGSVTTSSTHVTSKSGTFTFSSTTTNRKAVVAVSGRATDTSAFNVTGVTVNGYSLTRAVQRNTADRYGVSYAAIFIGDVPTGSGSLTVTSTVSRSALMGFGVWETWNILSNTPVSSKTLSEGTITFTNTLPNDLIFACGQGDFAGVTWTNITESYDIIRASGASITNTATGNYSITANFPAYPGMAGAVFR